nr:glucan endo-1,3-beta-glucosidase 8-like [Ipomoea batatas]
MQPVGGRQARNMGRFRPRFADGHHAGELKDNHIDKVKLFDSDHWTVNFFAGTGIEVLPGIPNNQLQRFADDFDNAKDWVKENISTHMHDGGVKIKYIAVGNEPFLKAYNGSFLHSVFPALQNIQKALDEAGLGNKIKATIPQNADVYSSGTGGPSDGNFRKDIRDLMIKICRFLRDHRSPFIVNIYPFLRRTYSNMFDANLDTLIWSLKKAQCEDVSVIVGEIGWPTDGNKNANLKMAEKFYKGFPSENGEEGRHAGAQGGGEFYLFSFTHENTKSVAPGGFERHWGIFGYDGQAQIPDRLHRRRHREDAGRRQARAVPPGAVVRAQPRQERLAIRREEHRINNQDVEACNFEGLAKIVKSNASTGGCLFPLRWRVVGPESALGSPSLPGSSSS